MPRARTSWWATLLAVASVLGYFVLSYYSLFGLYGAGLGVEDYQGRVIVDQVDPGSAAESAGMAVGDQLLSVNGQRLSNVVDWLALRMNFASGRPVTVHIFSATPSPSTWP
jgi:S1-C subfamily serine protease